MMRTSHIPRGMYQLLLVVSLTGGCSEDPGSSSSENPSVEPPVISFEDATLDSGLEFATVSGAQPSTQILEVKGGGLALIDFDSDGDRDLLVPNGATLDEPEKGPGARLFRNDGGLKFTDVTLGSGIQHQRWSFGTAVGDVDGDGKISLGDFKEIFKIMKEKEEKGED